ncbi:MAG: hypothetical protein CMF99_06185 [Candidatus Marinimicrobia bacterium]|nr:hypothetical protein [Candidatus Neomarinimicrobiota bacterium]
MLFSYCGTNSKINERVLLQQKLEAFEFLSKYHHQLHIMIGEDEGDVNKAYIEFKDAIIKFDNIELLPIKKAISRINPNNVNQNEESVKRLDYLVDYYQSGLSMQIEAIFRGYGYLEIIDFQNATDLYDKIKN